MFWLTKNPDWTCPMMWDVLFWPSLQNVLKVVVRNGGWERHVVGFGIFLWDLGFWFCACLQNVLKVAVRNGGWERHGQFFFFFSGTEVYICRSLTSNNLSWNIWKCQKISEEFRKRPMWKISVLWPSYQGRLINLQVVLLVSADMKVGWLVTPLPDTPIILAM